MAGARGERHTKGSQVTHRAEAVNREGDLPGHGRGSGGSGKRRSLKKVARLRLYVGQLELTPRGLCTFESDERRWLARVRRERG